MLIRFELGGGHQRADESEFVLDGQPRARGPNVGNNSHNSNNNSNNSWSKNSNPTWIKAK